MDPRPPTGAGPRAAPYRGWYVVAVLFLGGFAVYGGGLYSFILFVAPLSEEFHWSRAATGGLVSAFFLSAPLSLFAAPLISRFGVRRLAAGGIVVEACCLMLLMATSQLWQMYLLRAFAGIGKVLYALTLPVIVARWFSRNFGLALALMYSGWHIGGLVLAPVTGQLIHAFGWRQTSLVLGIGLIVVALVPTLWILRISTPQELGTGPDGDALSAAGAAPVVAAAAGGTGAAPPGTVREVVVSPAFQLVAAAAAVYWMIYSGVLAHQAALVQGSGTSAEKASFVLGATAGCGAFGAIVIGRIMDRWSMLRATIVLYALFIGGVGCLWLVTRHASMPLLVAHAIAFGLAIGGSDVYWISVLKRRVSTAAFPTAWGIYYFVELVALIIGPAAVGHLFDQTGNYRTVLSCELLALAVPAAVSLAMALRERQG